MMKEMNKKVAATFALLIFALSVLGLAYAHWTDIIYINGKVEMGELIFGFTELLGCDDGKMDYWNSPADYKIFYPEPKPVGTIECWFDPDRTETSHGKFGYPVKTVYKKLWVSIENAYPSYVGWCDYTLDNAGTIPLDVYMYCVIVEPGDGLTYRWSADETHIEGFFVDDAGNEQIVLNIWFEPFFFGQIDPCNSVPQRIYVHVKQPAEECHTYMFEIMIHAHEWDP